MKKISLDELLKLKKELPYKEQYKYIVDLIEDGIISPVKILQITEKPQDCQYFTEPMKRKKIIVI